MAGRNNHMNLKALESWRKSLYAQMPTETLKLLINFNRPDSQLNIKGIVFLLLICGAYGIDTSNQINNTVKKQEKIKDICGNNSLTSFNKPKFEIAIHDDQIVPRSCVEQNNTDLCISHRSAMIEHEENTKIKNLQKSNLGKIWKLRGNVKQQHNKWKESTEEKIKSITNPLNEKQLVTFNNLYESLTDFMLAYYSTQGANRAEGGNCGEHTRVALLKLLKEKINNRLEVKIQFVKLFYKQSKNKIKDHGYLLTDSNAEDIDIKDNKNLVSDYLDHIETGQICDPWNNGYFKEFKANNNLFYKKEGGWDSLSVKTISFDFAALNSLPDAAKEFFCTQLFQIGLLDKPNDSCRFFNSDKTLPEETISTEKPKKLVLQDYKVNKF